MINRRNFLVQMSLATTALSTGCLELQARPQTPKGGSMAYSNNLMPTAAKNTAEIFLELPTGFQYTVFGKKGSSMQDGHSTPALHDGMACFKVKNELRLVRNHEVRDQPLQNAAIGRNAYDKTAGGGTTTLIIDPITRELIKDFVSLSGTLVNCAGGKTPWGSWISCEETTVGKTDGYDKPHGYCFEVPASADAPVPPVPLKAMGRFKHEAVAVDEHTGIIYLTEDNEKSAVGFYRFLPKQPQQLAAGGVLQMLKIKDAYHFDTRKGLKQGQRFTTEWITIEDPDSEAADIADIDESAVFKQGLAKGAAKFSRLEGAYAAQQGSIYFVSTNGGDAKCGQIWRYDHINDAEGILTLHYESPSREILDMPDNICFQPNTRHLFICEDSDYPGKADENHIRILCPDGKIVDFAKNMTKGFETSEFAGATFSPDGETLFVNLQAPGVTLAIWGDWKSLTHIT